MAPVLTIVVPAYNVEKYIKQNIESILKCRCIEEIEILIVDDGSSDETGKIADEYAREYASIEVIHKENGGHGSTINTGIQYAQGKYFKIVDGDDWIDPKELDKLIHVLETAKEQLVICDYQEVYVQSEVVKKKSFCWIENQTLPISNIACERFLTMHALTFQTEILKKMPQRIDENCFYVDMEYMLFAIPFVKEFRYIRSEVYQYRLERTGQSIGAEGYRKHYRDAEKVLFSLLGYYQRLSRQKGDFFNEKIINDYLPQKIFDVYYRHILRCIRFLDYKKVSVGKYLRYFDNKIRRNHPEDYGQILQNPRLMGRLSAVQLRLLRKTGFRIWLLVKVKEKVKDKWKNAEMQV